MLLESTPPTYVAFDATAEINGSSMNALLEALPLLPRPARELLERHGLPSQPRAGGWYPVQAWLNALQELERTYGAASLYQIGLHVLDNSVWLPPVGALRTAIEAMDRTYRANVRGVNIGFYRLQEIGPTEVHVNCYTPNPPDLELGLLTSLARKFKPAEVIRVRVEALPTTDDANPALKLFRVAW